MCFVFTTQWKTMFKFWLYKTVHTTVYRNEHKSVVQFAFKIIRNINSVMCVQILSTTLCWACTEMLNAAHTLIMYPKETEQWERQTERENKNSILQPKKVWNFTNGILLHTVLCNNLSFAWRHVWTWEAADICWRVWVCERGEAVVPAGGPLTWGVSLCYCSIPEVRVTAW